jgi:transglutaminase-like putative cysteine protease
VTYVGSTVEDLLEGGAGVCQDFAHLSLALLRDLGIAARYVSGYFYATSGDQVDAASAEVQTHAWIEALLPAEGGGEPRWSGADPTNRRLAGPEHVKIGHGRRYGDIPPIKGVFRGVAGSHMESSVRMTRADAGGVPA